MIPRPARRAVALAKQIATKVDPGFARTPLARGGAPDQEITSAGTSIKQVPAILKTLPKERDGHRNLDIGGGKFDLGTQHLATRGIENHVLDPFNRPEEHNTAVLKAFKQDPADTVTAANVLNVIQHPHHRATVIKNAHKYLKPGGKAYFGIYEGDRSGKGRVTKEDQWQNNMPAAAYHDEVAQVFPKVERRGNVIIGHKTVRKAGGGEVSDDAPAPLYSSPLQDAIASSKQASAPAQDWKNILSPGKAPNLTQEEIDYSGLHDFLDQQRGHVTRDALLSHVRNNPAANLKEVWKHGDRKSSGNYSVSHTPFGHQVYGDEGRPIDEPFKTETEALAHAHALNHAGNTKYASYVTPGGKNYREMLMTLPGRSISKADIEKRAVELAEKEFAEKGDRFATPSEMEEVRKHIGYYHPDLYEKAMREHGLDPEDPVFNSATKSFYHGFKSQHWDEPNVLAHVRMTDRSGPKGEKLLHLEELQSDWHQQGREEGYQVPGGKGPEYAVYGGGSRLADGLTKEQAERHAEQFRDLYPDDKIHVDVTGHQLNGGVPDAPYKDTKAWSGLLMRRMMRYAADNGYDGLSWTTGDQQADRYDLSKQIDMIEAHHERSNGGRQVTIRLADSSTPVDMMLDKDGRVSSAHHNGQLSDQLEGKHLRDVIGKEHAEKILSRPDRHELHGEDLKIGGAGMRKFYDEILPSVANAIGKPFGVKHQMLHFEGPKRHLTIMPPLIQGHQYHLHDEEGNHVDSSLLREDLERKRQQIQDAEHMKLHYIPVPKAARHKPVRMFRQGGLVPMADVSRAMKVVRGK